MGIHLAELEPERLRDKYEFTGSTSAIRRSLDHEEPVRVTGRCGQSDRWVKASGYRLDREWGHRLRVNAGNLLIKWSHLWDLNPGPALYESAALPLS